MTTKQKFECDEPEVVRLANGRYAFKALCPWEGKGGKALHAWKFCSKQTYIDSLPPVTPEKPTKQNSDATEE